jgi:hypothetical protein
LIHYPGQAGRDRHRARTRRTVTRLFNSLRSPAEPLGSGIHAKPGSTPGPWTRVGGRRGRELAAPTPGELPVDRDGHRAEIWRAEPIRRRITSEPELTCGFRVEARIVWR